MKALKNILSKTPILGAICFFFIRARNSLRYFLGPLSSLFIWLFTSRETTNYTYDLEAKNKLYLSSLVSDITGEKASEINSYLQELEKDIGLVNHIKKMTSGNALSYVADKASPFGRRIGWYLFVRATKPKIVVETGVDKGLGACVLTSALKRNSEEGHEGYYFGTDINPEAGYLLSGEFKKFGEILYGDSIDSLKKINKRIDLFINDSDHSADYEAREYETVQGMLSHDAIILGDNSHVTDKLFNFSIQTDRHFIFFQEKPFKHWYPGAGIGISFRRKETSSGYQ